MHLEFYRYMIHDIEVSQNNVRFFALQFILHV